MHNEWIRLISAGGLLGLAAIAPTEGWVTGLSKQEIGQGVQLKIEGKDLSQPRELRLLGGKAYIVEFNAKLQGSAKSLDVDSAGVSSAKALWYRSKPPVVRVLVRLQPDEKPVLAACDGGYTISVNVPTEQKPAKADKPKAKPSGAQADPMLKQPMPVDATRLKAAKEAAAGAQRVSLDFVNTDVVQILKALALQADVNIVTAPEVTGKKITVSLDKVTVNDALDFVTALAGLRYARVQDSYVVTTTALYGPTMMSLAPRNPNQNVIRIVPIVSGEGDAIKAAVLKWFGPIPLQVMLPGEQEKLAAAVGGGSSAPSPAGGGAAGAGQAAAPGAPPAAAPSGQAPQGAAPGGGADTKKDATETPYLVLVGDQKWVSQAEALVHKLDEEVIDAESEHNKAVKIWDHNKQMLEAQLKKELDAGKPEPSSATYMVQSGLAADLKKVIDDSDHSGTVTLVASPVKSTVQTLLISGPEDAVAATITKLRTLDTGAGATSKVYMYDIKYADPRSLREDLVANVPGLIVTNPPAAAANPRLYNKGTAFSQQSQTQATTAPSSAGAQGQGGQSSQQGVGHGGGSFGTPDLPFDDQEPSALPMRLVLRGSDTQIQEALKYLGQVDIAPKQLAIEMRVMELSKEDAIQLGINWSLLTGGTVKTINLNQSQGGINGNQAPANSITGRLGFNGGSFGSVTASLDAIANKNNLISRPNLLAMDGRESEIFVGDDIKYVSSIVSSQTGPTITSDEIKVGVRLSVLPRIGGDGHITMDMRPVVSFLKGFTSTNSTGITLNLPQTSVRFSQSTVSMQSGETIAIGGLIQDQDIMNVQKLPFLGDLPIFGQLFRQTTHDRKRSEVVFFLTAREVTPDDRKEAADPRPNEKLNKGEMPIPARKLLP
ncbi:MAG TPA: hypothetical protein VKT78_03175 [Fimbriimonadaceae bacterium]|nr:hypothetical protein [Fimbriimonadaceae bacterium]